MCDEYVMCDVMSDMVCDVIMRDVMCRHAMCDDMMCDTCIHV